MIMNGVCAARCVDGGITTISWLCIMYKLIIE